MTNYHNSTFKAKPGKPKRRKVKAKPSEIKDHWSRVIELGPYHSMRGAGRLTIHHCHSGSMSDNGWHRGMGQKPSDWLVICLPQSLHFANGQAIDGSMSVRDWEELYGTQYEALCWTAEQLGVDVFEKARNG